MNRWWIGVVALMATGCLAGKGGKGSGKGGSADGGNDATEDPACETTMGVLQGAVYYWAPPGDPDSIAADSVDVLLTQGGPTYRTGTTPLGTFSVPIEAGSWTLAADDQIGCASERVETVMVEPCEATEVNLVIDLCSY